MKNVFFVSVLLAMYSGAAQAYLGLGPVLPFIGSALVLVFAVLLAIFGVFLKPILRRLRKSDVNVEEEQNTEQENP